MPMLRVGVFILCAVPAALLSERLLTGGLGANPVEALLHGTGSWGLRLLLVTLAITPLRHITGANWLVRLRRQIGLWAFAYAAAHFLIFIVFEHRAVLSSIVEDIIARPYILIGTSAFLLLMPLAITSTKGWIRRLGKRWQRLHWLIYPAAVLGVVHFFMLIRANRWTEPLIYAAVLVLLLGFRVLRRWRVG
ncbi:MAG: sulfoxide reductase heme-binding subunit YedZ [Gammaproteobacteria bacterium]|nr:sulfoxide reductase heme-binding subunit YedZ [Gammaproteobacteria bacterium]